MLFSGEGIILAESETHTNYLATISRQAETHGETIEKIVYANGHKLWPQQGGEAWWTDLTLRQAGFEPAEDRTGLMIETGGGEILLVAINGQLADEELDGLVNSIIPAREYTVR